jgi:tetratricopeptide (TPR) repeat protein
MAFFVQLTANPKLAIAYICHSILFMKFYNTLIRYRFLFSLLGLVLAIYVNVITNVWAALILYIVSIIGLFTHFFVGPLRLVQEPMEQGNIEEVERILNSIKYPKLLYKPIRSTYYTLKGNMAMMKQDFEGAEKHLKMSSELGAPMPEAEGANKLQLGMMSLQKGDFKQGESYIRAAIRMGLGDKESEAIAFLSMCQIFMNKREYKAAKDFFRKAKACKPTQKQTVDQIKEIEKYISRIPG